MNQLIDMGKKFKQRDETTHLSIELMDRLFLSQDYRVEVTKKNIQLYSLTCALIAGKYDELDENIPLISELQRHLSNLLTLNEMAPHFNDVVECERQVMRFFNWDLMMIMPIHFIKCLLSNGVLFNNEQGATTDTAKRISHRCM